MPTPLSTSLVVKVVQGKVSLYRSTGAFLKTLCTGAASAVVQGDEVHVSMPNGQVRIYRTSGAFLRSI